MKSIVLVLMIITFFLPISAQKRLKVVEINESGRIVENSFIPLKDELLYDGIKITVNPVSASDLDSLFFSEDIYKGEHHYSYYTSSRNEFFMRRRTQKDVVSDMELLLKGIDGLSENNIINDQEYSVLYEDIMEYYDYDLDIENRKKSSNPYFNGDKYLSTFRIDLENTTNSYKSIDNDFLVSAGNQLQYPLDNDDLILLSQEDKMSNRKKLQNILKYNLPETIVIPPHLNVVKYFAIIPQNISNKTLNISHSDFTDCFKWQVQTNTEVIDNKYNYYELIVSWMCGHVYAYGGAKFYVIKSDGDIYIDKDKAFVNSSDIDKDVELFSVSLYRGKVYYSRQTFNISDYINEGKKKRETIIIEASELKDIKE